MLHGAHQDAPSRLVLIATSRLLCCGPVQEENLRAALVLEQAAQCLLHTSPPHVRKYAFHMVLSGLRYNSCGQQQLGMRAYRCGPNMPPCAVNNTTAVDWVSTWLCNQWR